MGAMRARWLPICVGNPVTVELIAGCPPLLRKEVTVPSAPVFSYLNCFPLVVQVNENEFPSAVVVVPVTTTVVVALIFVA